MSVMDSTPQPQKPLLAVFPAHASQDGAYMFMGLSEDSAGAGCCSGNISYVCYSPDGAVRYRIVKEGLFFESARVLDCEGALLATMDKSSLSLAKWAVKDPQGRVVASTATVPGLAKYGVQLFLPSSSKAALMCAPTGDLRSLGVWQCGKRINRDDGQEYAEAAYGSNVILGFVSALMQDTTYHVTLEPGADALLAACLISVADQLMQWDSVSWVA